MLSYGYLWGWDSTPWDEVCIQSSQSNDQHCPHQIECPQEVVCMGLETQGFTCDWPFGQLILRSQSGNVHFLYPNPQLCWVRIPGPDGTKASYKCHSKVSTESEVTCSSQGLGMARAARPQTQGNYCCGGGVNFAHHQEVHLLLYLREMERCFWSKENFLEWLLVLLP